MESFVRNCLLVPRVLSEVIPGQITKTDTIFIDDGNKCVVRLDGYAVVPVEDWNRLCAKAGEPQSAVTPSQAI